MRRVFAVAWEIRELYSFGSEYSPTDNEIRPYGLCVYGKLSCRVQNELFCHIYQCLLAIKKIYAKGLIYKGIHDQILF